MVPEQVQNCDGLLATSKLRSCPSPAATDSPEDLPWKDDEVTRATAPIVSLLILLGVCPVGAVAEEVTPPNFLLIVADDLGFSDLGCYGGEIETRHLDRLADGGLRLTQFYTTGRCCPSRASLLTGFYPHRVGLGHMTQDIGQSGYRGRLVQDAKTIADHLAVAGYRSFLSGKWHLGTDDPTRHGFEEFYGTLTSAKTFWEPDHYRRLPRGRRPRAYERAAFYGTDALADHAIDFLRLADQTPERPWFLYLAFNAPHFPLQARPDAIAKYAETYSAGWDETRRRRLDRMKALGIVPQATPLTPRSEQHLTGRPSKAPAEPVVGVAVERSTDRSGSSDGYLCGHGRLNGPEHRSGPARPGSPWRPREYSDHIHIGQRRLCQVGSLRFRWRVGTRQPTASRDGDRKDGFAGDFSQRRFGMGQCIQRAVASLQALQPRRRDRGSLHRALAGRDEVQAGLTCGRDRCDAHPLDRPSADPAGGGRRVLRLATGRRLPG